MLDYYLENPQKLAGQPKRTIGDYVHQNGILVPRRFAGLEQTLDFMDSGKRGMNRSEHLQEYNCASGLLQSYRLDKSRVAGISQRDFETSLKELSKENVSYYCELLELDFKTFFDGISYSYWEEIDGNNGSIISDSAIPGKYHLFSSGKEDWKYLVVDNGAIIKADAQVASPQLLSQCKDIITFYESIRRLPHFDSNHCPMIEFQTDSQGRNWFLQYHRTRSMQPATFTLDREKRDGETEATFVRGATSSEGEIFRVLLNYQPGAQFYRANVRQEILRWNIDYLTRGYRPNRQFPQEIVDEMGERAVKPAHLPSRGQNSTVIDAALRHPVFEEIMSRTNELSIIPGTADDISFNIGNSHISKSAIANSRLTIGVPREFIGEIDDSCSGAKFKVVSDGRRAYISRLN